MRYRHLTAAAAAAVLTLGVAAAPAAQAGVATGPDAELATCAKFRADTEPEYEGLNLRYNPSKYSAKVGYMDDGDVGWFYSYTKNNFRPVAGTTHVWASDAYLVRVSSWTSSCPG